jgi:hypothetical protein
VLMTRREEKAEKLGRPLMPGEDADVFREFGHPILVAARYGRQQTLIGPEIYPLYALAMKALLAIVLISVLISGVVRILAEGGAPGPGIVRMLAELWSGTISVVGVLTVIAWVMERYRVRLRIFERWDPNELPRPVRGRAHGPADAIAGIVFGGVFLLWWTGAMDLGIPMITTEEGWRLQFALGPVWADVYWPIIALTVGSMALHAVRLAQGMRRTRASLGGEFVLHGAGLVLWAWMVRHGPWLVLGPRGDHPARLAAAMPGVNLGLQAAIVVIITIAVAALALDAWRFWRLGREANG